MSIFTRVNLNTTHVIPSPQSPLHALPVSVDLNWLKTIAADPQHGILNTGHVIAPNQYIL